MTSLVISDLHLSSDFPQRTQMLSDLLTQQLPSINRLYILGDLFDYWIGDDGSDRLGHRPVVDLIRSVSDRGVTVSFIRGNRDFLVGDQFCEQAGVGLLSDRTVVDIHGQNSVLCHGDHLCTDDVDHQAFRKQVDSPQWQQGILSQSLEQRHQLATKIRTTSDIEKQNKPNAIMDVADQAVVDEFNLNDCNVIIHGHTHRPAVHKTRVNGKTCWRIVLGDWVESPSYLKISADSLHLESGSGRDNVMMDWPPSG